MALQTQSCLTADVLGARNLQHCDVDHRTDIKSPWDRIR
jgi:hypothetical protein